MIHVDKIRCNTFIVIETSFINNIKLLHLLHDKKNTLTHNNNNNEKGDKQQ